MDVFKLRDKLIGDYSDYVRSFIHIRDAEIDRVVSEEFEGGAYWPDPLIQLNPSFEFGASLEQLVKDGLHPEIPRLFKKSDGNPIRLYRHQEEAIRASRGGENYVLTTGTGSGKSLSYLIPITDHVLQHGTGRGVQAIVVYPMNALVNSQREELGKFLGEARGGPVTYGVYTGQEKREQKEAILESAPDILLTNYVMLELILTRAEDQRLVRQARGLRFLVFDELHTYRGRQGADVGFLIRRAREAFAATPGEPDRL